MHILIVNNTRIPAVEYGGIERVIWWLGKALVRMGHRVTYLVAPGSTCPFAPVLPYDPARPLNDQIPAAVDFVHCHFQPEARLDKPYLVSHHCNDSTVRTYDANTVFSSRKHAERHQSTVYVYNGLDPDEYGPVDLDRARKYLLFMAYAKRPEKNLAACRTIARRCRTPLAVIGGRKRWHNSLFNTKHMGFLGGQAKHAVLQNSQALLTPVLWHEPFGLAIIEALYFGCPVFGTPYGSLPELVVPSVGFLSNSLGELTDAVRTRLPGFSPRTCHDYVCEHFNAARMARDYLTFYARVLNGEAINLQPPKTLDPFDRNNLLPFIR